MRERRRSHAFGVSRPPRRPGRGVDGPSTTLYGGGWPIDHRRRARELRLIAAVTGAPVRVDARLLADPDATGKGDWESFPSGAAELVAETREHWKQFLPRDPR